MKWCLLMLALVLFAQAQPKTESVAYYIQLIRSSDQEQSPVPNGKRISPHLAGTFHAVFKWRTYWEICSRRVELEIGRVTRVRLNAEREVEIDLTDANRRSVSAFLNGKRVQRTVCPRSESRTFLGGDRDGNSAWFIIVSRNKPEE